MLIIQSSINGTIVYDNETERTLFETDSAVELALYCGGLQKSFPGLKFSFENIPARGAIFSTGKKDGKKLREEARIYRTSWSFGGLESSFISTSKLQNLAEALEDIKLGKTKAGSYILIDTNNKTVKIIKGAIDPFEEMLNKQFTSWKIDKVKE